MTDELDNVIHVSFRRDGTFVRKPATKPAPQPPPLDAPPTREPRRDPLASLYTRKEAASFFGCTESRLAYWDKTGFIAPSGRVGRRRLYTFQDLISIRAAKGLIDGGIPLRTVRRSVEALRSALPKVARPLAELRVMADGQSVLVRDGAAAFEPTTGQLVLDFRIDDLRDQVVRVLRTREPNAEQRRSAYEHYLEGCRLDSEEATFDRAEAAYRRAVELDPSLANALTNLGNLRYRRGRPDEAEQFYRRALSLDPAQPEAFYNLGFLAYERGDLEEAALAFEQALESDPAFADAHFNLAMVYEEMRRSLDARSHWGSYIELEPDGPWAEIARRHLAPSS